MPKPNDTALQAWAMAWADDIQEYTHDLSELEYARVMLDALGYVKEEAELRAEGAGLPRDEW